jgi:hypothetical protein
MNEIEENQLKSQIAKKLSPQRFPNVSGKMVACLAGLLNQKWAKPRIASLVGTSDNILLARLEGDVGFNEVIGSFSDFEQNVLGMADAAGDLTTDERSFLEELLKRVEEGKETSAGSTSTDLSIEAISGSSN